jgi:hypothetical protein
MKKLILLLKICMFFGTLFPWSKQEVLAQSCNYFAGTAVTGEKVNVNTCSISRSSYQSVDFVYYLGKKRIISQANCNHGYWTTFPDREIHRPQSQATQRMLDTVCSYGR